MVAMSNPFEEVIKHGFGWLKLNYEYKGVCCTSSTNARFPQQ